MNCQQTERWLHMLVDDELADDDRVQVEAHLTACDACRSELTLVERMQQGTRAAAQQIQAPDALVAKVEAHARRARRSGGRKIIAAALPLSIAAIALVVAGFALSRADEAAASTAQLEQRLPAASLLSGVLEQAVQTHTRALPVDVASPDPRRVAQYLQARGVPLLVPKLDHVGLDLAGGRVVSVTDRPGAQLVYRGALGGRLSVVAWPSKAELVEHLSPIAPGFLFDGDVRGVRVRLVQGRDATYSFIGDAHQDALDALRGALK